MSYPLVSAIVLCYNQARFVVECLESVKAQRYPNLELIVNDDASRDGSASVIQAWLAKSDLPHLFLRQEENQGLCRSLNQALRRSRGKYISGIAADDVWLPGKLIHQVERMERGPEGVGVVYSDALQMDESGGMLPERFIGAQKRFNTMPNGNIHRILWEGNFIPAMTTLVRRICYEKVGFFDEALFYEDWDMWLRISREFEFSYSDQVSAKYRHVATSMMNRHSHRVADAVCQVCVKHLKSADLDPDAKEAATAHLRLKAAAAFGWQTPGHRRDLLQALRYSPSLGLGVRLFFTFCGLGPRHFERVRSLLCRSGLQGVG